MTLSPKKYVSNYTTCTVQRGVEAKDIELGATNLGNLFENNVCYFYSCNRMYRNIEYHDIIT